MDENVTVVKKVGLIEKVRNFKDLAFIFCKTHPDIILSLIASTATIAGAGLQIHANKIEYRDHVFTEVDNKIYKIPAKQMETMNKQVTYKPKK